jgi:integrase
LPTFWETLNPQAPGAQMMRADLVRFLAYGGCRISEAANVKRDDVDLQAGTIRIYGDPVHGTKNSESRTIPINPAMHDLCARLLDDRREPRDPKRRGKGYLSN